MERRIIAGYVVTRDGHARRPGRPQHARTASDLAGLCERCGALYTRGVEPSGRLESARDWRARRFCSRACGSRERTARAARIAESPGTMPAEGAPTGIVLAVWARRYRHLMPREEAVQVAELMNLLPAGDGPWRAADRGLRRQLRALGWRRAGGGWTSLEPCDDRGE